MSVDGLSGTGEEKLMLALPAMASPYKFVDASNLSSRVTALRRLKSRMLTQRKKFLKETLLVIV